MKYVNQLVAVLCLFAVSSVHAQKSDFDREIDFTKYESYSFAGWDKDSGETLDDFDKKRVVDAIKAELDARGLQQMDEGGDISITGYIVLSQESSTTAYSAFHGDMGSNPRWGWGMGPGQSGATTEYEESDYTEGTLILDMFDQESKNLIWQGMDQEVVKSKPSRRDKQIPKIVGKIMTEFPISLSN